MLKTFANNFFNSITHLSINRSSFGRIKSIAVESKPSTSARMEYIFRSLSQLFAFRNQTQNKRFLPVLCCCSILTFKLLSHHSPLPENTVLHCCHFIVLCMCVCVYVLFLFSFFLSLHTVSYFCNHNLFAFQMNFPCSSLTTFQRQNHWLGTSQLPPPSGSRLQCKFKNWTE